MQRILPQMQSYRSAYEGGQSFKNSVLVKRPSEDAALFRDKLVNTAALPVCKAIVDEIVDVVYETPPTRHPAFLTSANIATPTPDWFQAFLEDSDMQGNEIDGVMEQACTMAGIEGWSWIFVDLPEEESTNNRPYLSTCSAEHVIDWRTYTEYGRDFIEYLKVIEYADSETTVLKIWYSGDALNPTYCERYILTQEHLKNMDVDIEPNETYFLAPGLPIPAVQVIARSDQRRHDLGVSDLTEAADVQRELLKLEAEAYDSIRFSKPMIRAAAGVRVPAGGGGIIRGDKDSVEVFAIPTQDISEIRAQQESLITRLDGFLGRGGLRTTKMQVQSGISIVEERRALHRKAGQRARQMESAEEQVFILVAQQMGLKWVGEVEYSTDYEDKDTQFRLALLQTAQQLTQGNPVVQQIINTEVIKMIAPPDDVQAYLQKIGVYVETVEPLSEPEPGEASPSQKGPTEEQTIYGGEIRDAGVTTNDPISRQLIQMGQGR
jgi:hypothetical protein